MADVAGLLNTGGAVSSLIPGGQLVGMGLSLAGQVFGAARNARLNKQNENIVNTQLAKNEAEFNNSANRDFLDTNVAKNAVTQAQNDLKDERKAVEGRAAITGASDEAVIAGNSAVRKNYADRLGQLASYGTQYRDNKERMFKATEMGLLDKKMQLNQQRAEGAMNLASNAGDLMNTVAMGSGFDKKTPHDFRNDMPLSKAPTIAAKSVSVGGERQFVQPDKLMLKN